MSLIQVCVLLLIVLAIDEPLRRSVESYHRLRQLKMRQQVARERASRLNPTRSTRALRVK